jgi:hypothetical protein
LDASPLSPLLNGAYKMELTANRGRAPTGAPAVPAVWTAFANASRWKSWALLGQFVLNVLLIFVALRVAKTDPDVVVVAEDGKSTYVPRAVAGSALVRFLESEKQKPSDVTVLHFTAEFLDAFFAVNSSTLDAAFPKALGMMDARLKGAVAREYADGKVLETYRLAQVRSQLAIGELLVLQKTDSLIHLSAKLERKRSSLVDGSRPSTDALEVELVERVVPRTAERPDGLEIAELSVRRLSAPSAKGTDSTPSAAVQGEMVRTSPMANAAGPEGLSHRPEARDSELSQLPGPTNTGEEAAHAQ